MSVKLRRLLSWQINRTRGHTPLHRMMNANKQINPSTPPRGDLSLLLMRQSVCIEPQKGYAITPSSGGSLHLP